MTKMLKQKNATYIGIILAIEILLILFCVLVFGSFGFDGDYYTQHSVIPKMFRQLFYETGRLVPDNAWQLGGGQNIYNFSYYGLLSPIILVTYLFPWVDMLICMQVLCALLYCSIGILTYIWLKKHFTKHESFCGALMMAFATPVLYNFQNQIVFVECLPFVILTLIAVDRMIRTGKTGCLIIASFLMIMVNYYSAIPCLGAVAVYYLYCYFKENNKLTIKALWTIVRPLLISVLMAGVLLIPTAYSIMNSQRINSESYHWWEILLVPDYKDLYNPKEMGLTYTFVFAFIAILAGCKSKLSEKFLSISIFVLTFVPFVIYAVNGGNYIRNKMSIPLWPLWILLVLLVYRRVKNKDLNYKKIGIIFTIVTACLFIYAIISIIFFKENDYYKTLAIVAEFAAIVIIFNLVKKRNNYKLFLGSLIVLMLGITIVYENISEHYGELYYESAGQEAIENILNSDKSTYRIDNSIKYSFDINRVFGEDYYTNSIYTSTSNKDYMNFVRNDMGNGIYLRNYLMLWGCHNPLFSSYMGNKYAVSNYDIESDMYKKIGQKNKINIYKDKNAFPLVYGRKACVSKKEFDKLKFPYKADCLLNNVVADEGNKPYENTGIKEYAKGKYKTSMHFEVNEESKKFSQKLPEPVKGKYLIIQFNVKQSDDTDLVIIINEYKNVLTSKSAHWDNKNTTFTYVLPVKENMKKLNFRVREGVFDISNIKLYTYDFDDSKIYIDRGQNIKIDKKSSTVTASLMAKDNEYLVTSFPYDEGYKVFVDDKEVGKINLDDGFLGCKINKGQHNVRIEYHSPWKNIGLAVTCFGCLLFIIEMIVGIIRRRKCTQNH